MWGWKGSLHRYLSVCAATAGCLLSPCMEAFNVGGPHSCPRWLVPASDGSCSKGGFSEAEYAPALLRLCSLFGVP